MDIFVSPGSPATVCSKVVPLLLLDLCFSCPRRILGFVIGPGFVLVLVWGEIELAALPLIVLVLVRAHVCV